MADKLFGRVARLTVGTRLIERLRFSFSVQKSIGPTPNKAEIKISNLAPTSIADIEQQTIVPVMLQAGYESGIQTLFLGDLRTGATVRERDGSTTTILKAGDGEKAMRSGTVRATLSKGSTPDAVLTLLATGVGVLPGNLNDALALIKAKGKNPFPFGTTIEGNAAREMTNFCRAFDLEWSVQNGALQFTERTKALVGTASLVSEATGMVGSPSIDPKGVLSVKTLLDPSIAPGRLMVLNAERLKGQFKITDCDYKGDTHANEWTVDIKAKRY